MFIRRAHQTLTTSQQANVQMQDDIAAPHIRVRILEIHQINNEVNVIANLTGKFIQQQYWNYYCGNRITSPKVPQVFNNPTRTMGFFAIVIHI